MFYGIAEHDLNVKLKNAFKNLEKGSDVRLVLKFKGRQAENQEIKDKFTTHVESLMFSYKQITKQFRKQDVAMVYRK